MAQLLSFKFEWSHQPYPVAPRVSQQAFEMPLGAFLHNLDVKLENVVGAGTAAARNVGIGAGNVMEVGAFGLGLTTNTPYISSTTDLSNLPNGLYGLEQGGHSGILVRQTGYTGLTRMGVLGFPSDATTSAPFYYRINLANGTTLQQSQAYRHTFYTTQNTTVDSNGYIKAASPIANLFNDHIELN
ncbi:hypothetical protein KXS08_06075, partial [Acinetobacter radioresistens]